MPSPLSFRRKTLFSRRKGRRLRIFRPKKTLWKRILRRIEERKQKKEQKPKKKRIRKGKAPPSFAVVVVLAVNPNGYYYIYHVVFKINIWSAFLQKIRELRERQSTVDMWVFTTADLVEGRLDRMIREFKQELREYKETLGTIYKLDGRVLTDYDIEAYGYIVLGELQTKVRKYGAYIQQRSLDEWGNEDENQSY